MFDLLEQPDVQDAPDARDAMSAVAGPSGNVRFGYEWSAKS